MNTQMSRRERLYAMVKKEPADRPGLNFYEIGGFNVDPDNQDPFNIYSSSSWRRLLSLAEEETDLIRMRSPRCVSRHPDYDKIFTTETYMKEGSRFTRTTLKAGGREFESLRRRDPELDTTWTIKHLLADVDDLDAYLSLPDEIFDATWSVDVLDQAEDEIGDSGIVMVDAADPLCIAAELFSMADYTIVALTEQQKFHRLLEKISASVYKRTRYVAESFPGHLWRICGPEYATEPYLPPYLFGEYVGKYTAPMVEAIHQFGGYARLHCHGRILSALPIIAEMGVDAIDPIEPPHQGDVELGDVASEYGDILTLFGNVEVTDLENLEENAFYDKTSRSVEAGSKAKGFVLMPTASPYGREISARTMKNYETMVSIIKDD